MNLDRAAAESATRVILAMVVGCAATRLSEAQRETLVTALLPVAWLFVSVWWSKKSDQAVQRKAP